MKINEIIRTLRKEQNLTQEQVANFLGVSAPAVNKWENAISYPDITLLAPLARLLKTNVDTLLSFQEELTEPEINQFIQDLLTEHGSLGFEKTFQKASDKTKEYPNCYKLILSVAQIMNGFLVMGIDEIPEKEKYQRQITAWFEMVAFSENKELANTAIMFLSHDFINNEKYEEAQKLLDQIPPIGFDKRVTQAKIYRHQGQIEKAYEILEAMIYENSNTLISYLTQMVDLLSEQKKYEEAFIYVELVSCVAKQFELGKFIEVSAKYIIYIRMHDIEKSLELLEEMIDGIDTLYGIRDSKLYPHMKLKETKGSLEMRDIIGKSLKVDSDLDFLRDHPKFKQLMNQFEK